MAAALGNLLSSRALRPLRDAAEHFCAGRVREGLDSIDAAELRRRLEEGVAAAAARAGVRPDDVARLLPQDEIRSALEALAENHAKANEIWREQGHRLGGFLAGVTEVTVDAERMDDAGFYLDRLASKLSRDKALAGPLDDLAADVTRWEQLVKRFGPILDDGKALRAAYLKKQLRRAALLTASLSVVVLLLAYALSLRAARARVEEGLDAAEPCRVESIATADMSRASAGQQTRAHELVALCADARERRAYEARCLRLAEHAESGQLDTADLELIGASSELLVRAYGGRLTAADLLAEPSFPCADVGVPERLWRIFVKAAQNAPPAWREARDVSPSLLTRLAMGGESISNASALAIASEAEPVAERAVLMGQHADVETAKAKCGLQEKLALPQGKWCAALGVALSRGSSP